MVTRGVARGGQGGVAGSRGGGPGSDGPQLGFVEVPDGCSAPRSRRPPPWVMENGSVYGPTTEANPGSARGPRRGFAAYCHLGRLQLPQRVLKLLQLVSPRETRGAGGCGGSSPGGGWGAAREVGGPADGRGEGGLPRRFCSAWRIRKRPFPHPSSFSLVSGAEGAPVRTPSVGRIPQPPRLPSAPGPRGSAAPPSASGAARKCGGDRSLRPHCSAHPPRPPPLLHFLSPSVCTRAAWAICFIFSFLGSCGFPEKKVERYVGSA